MRRNRSIALLWLGGFTTLLGCEKSNDSAAAQTIVMTAGPPSPWTYNEEWASSLTPTEVDRYQILLPKSFTPIPFELKNDSPNTVKVYAWQGPPLATDTPPLLIISTFSDPKALKGQESLRQSILHFLIGAAGTWEARTTAYDKGETGQLGGLDFIRLHWVGAGPKGLQLKGFVYGANDESTAIRILATYNRMKSVPFRNNWRDDRESRLMECIIATVKKRH